MRRTGSLGVLDQTFALEEIADAFRHEDAGAQVGKLCLQS
jgi:hypothetical protein